ncbi:MAG: putative O-methyltransferase involved in polyketide biosynthesis [Nocardia sp.]|uniref:class I SAM-dependent methyltransferase n=1 Tax=Nocardia sp. TaxID=1821 RepID=UPI00260D9A08|nr:class I SAM-dependent methyltransferase [Nocardia sp.]MCU1641436.1 putative O-methyltransferase involved in polyketide biosynthesis [Nocardia sp.]
MLHTIAPEDTALRVALWRALHLQVDAQPHVLEDDIGLKLAAPEENWRERPDMDPGIMARIRATIVARARLIEDLVEEQVALGVDQYVILGAGLDTFAQRRPDIVSCIRLFEVDQTGPQKWKRHRLIDLGYGLPEHLTLVPVDFEAESWWERLADEGFDADRPAVVASTGVTMYLTAEANADTFRQAAQLAPGSTFATTFTLPLELVEPEEQPGRSNTERLARAAGNPFISFYSPDEIIALAKESGFSGARHVSAIDLADRYFSGRADNLRPSSSEQILIATT